MSILNTFIPDFLTKMEASEADSIIVRLGHLKKNLEKFDKKFGQLTALSFARFAEFVEFNSYIYSNHFNLWRSLRRFSKPRLINSSHLSEWCQEISLSKNVEPPRHQPSDDFAHLCTLGRSIIEGDAKWDGDLHFIREFRYTKGYWEWTEDVLSRCGDRLRHLKIYDAVYASLFTYDHNSDIAKAFCEAWCPLTNALLTSAGEMSISLWDLHELVGLPMTGCLYDEVVPSALELTGVDGKRERFIPRSNNKYHPSPPYKEKKTVRPESTHNPLSDIAIHERWSTAEEALFVKLCIERSLKEEVYLVAYLACWLCVFALLGKDVNSIRPSTFKMASLMANGRRVNLAIPILASIYEGLNTVATSPKPVVWQELRGPKMTRFLEKEVQSIISHEKHASEFIRPSLSLRLAICL
ncbi:hypothetical protein Sango_1925100 [Sesamum angolense]|uniref:Aminotransferase-like plant mobile domain-containing protein n=1 Tax=Sesamum angolense TaxID=2727404 RepID=A0AAE2BN73_9LAMI|nr:hypothetical protein Sango_1925100 [Sesamum angolense]